MTKPKTLSNADLAAAARRLMRAALKTRLATCFTAGDGDGGGFDSIAGAPFASLGLAACDHDGAPLLLLSTLSDHTRNLAADPRLSLLFEEEGGRAAAFPDYPGEYPESDPYEDPLSRPRLTVIGEACPTGEPQHRQRFLARHPACALYAGFADFSIYRLETVKAHLVAGFARTAWFEAGELLLSGVTGDFAAAEESMVEHMNSDHADAVTLYATVLLGQAAADDPARPWRLTGVDPDGCDLRRGGRTARLDFAAPALTSEAVRAELVRLAKQAREQAG